MLREEKRCVINYRNDALSKQKQDQPNCCLKLLVKMLQRSLNFGYDGVVARKVEQLIADVALKENVELASTNAEICGLVVS